MFGTPGVSATDFPRDRQRDRAEHRRLSVDRHGKGTAAVRWNYLHTGEGCAAGFASARTCSWIVDGLRGRFVDSHTGNDDSALCKRRTYSPCASNPETDPLVTAMAPGPNDSILFASRLDGVFAWQKQHFETISSRASLPVTSPVLSILKTPSGDVWLGTRESGLLRIQGSLIHANHDRPSGPESQLPSPRRRRRIICGHGPGPGSLGWQWNHDRGSSSGPEPECPFTRWPEIGTAMYGWELPGDSGA